jgi:hypothetical protein
MSKYYVNKFLFQIDRDPDLLARYKANARVMVETWEQSIGPMLTPSERTSVQSLTPEERKALIEMDYIALFEMGAHFFLTLTLYIAVFEEDYRKEKGPLAFQREYASQLSHWLGRDYPSVAL